MVDRAMHRRRDPRIRDMICYQYDLFESKNGLKQRKAIGMEYYLGTPCHKCGCEVKLVTTRECVFCCTQKTDGRKEMNFILDCLTQPTSAEGNILSADKWVRDNLDYLNVQGIISYLVRVFKLTPYKAGCIIRQHGLTI